MQALSRLSHLGRAALCAGAAVVCAGTAKPGGGSAFAAAEPSANLDRGDLRLLAKSLAHLRPTEAEMRLRWERDELGWRKLPARAWPAYQPTAADIPMIAAKLKAGSCGTDTSGLLPVVKPEMPARGPVDCTQLAFDLATALLFNNVDAERGVQMYRHLAKSNRCVDAHVALGIALIEGINIEANPAEGIAFLQDACAHNSAQAFYEMGSAYYSGLAGVLEEDEGKAFELFEKAAQQKHTAGDEKDLVTRR